MKRPDRSLKAPDDIQGLRVVKPVLQVQLIERGQGLKLGGELSRTMLQLAGPGPSQPMHVKESPVPQVQLMGGLSGMPRSLD